MGTLETAFVTVTLATALANGGMAVADLRRAPFVLENAAAVDVPQQWVPVLGALKGLGAVGLVLGLAGAEPIGIAAGLGLTLFFVGAIVTHLRARDYALSFPAGYLLLAVSSLALAVATA